MSMNRYKLKKNSRLPFTALACHNFVGLLPPSKMISIYFRFIYIFSLTNVLTKYSHIFADTNANIKILRIFVNTDTNVRYITYAWFISMQTTICCPVRSRIVILNRFYWIFKVNPPGVHNKCTREMLFHFHGKFWFIFWTAFDRDLWSDDGDLRVQYFISSRT